MTWITKAGTVQLEKARNHFRLTNIAASGTTYVQDFELPEGETFVTNLGEHPLKSYSTHKIVLPNYLSYFQSYMPVDTTPQRMECFFLGKVCHSRCKRTLVVYQPYSQIPFRLRHGDEGAYFPGHKEVKFSLVCPPAR
jgi:hypothetical protein